MTTLEELDASIKEVINQQKAINKTIVGLQTTFSAIHQLFTMFAGNLGDLAKVDTGKLMAEGEKTNANVEATLAYMKKFYTDLYKGRLALDPETNKLTIVNEEVPS